MFERHTRYQGSANELKYRYNTGTTAKNEEQDHQPITPVHLPSIHRKLKDKTSKSELYTMIINGFFASLSEDALIEEVDADFKYDGEEFTAKYSEKITEGFLKYYPLDAET